MGDGEMCRCSNRDIRGGRLSFTGVDENNNVQEYEGAIDRHRETMASTTT